LVPSAARAGSSCCNAAQILRAFGRCHCREVARQAINLPFASAFIVGDPHRGIWEQHDESLEAFKERLAKAAADVARTQGFPERGQPTAAYNQSE
jgi:hypothetical protein